MKLLEGLEPALRTVLAARSAVAAAFPLLAEQLPPLASPAPRADIERLEASLGKPLPPSFRSFLAIHDGVSEIDLGTDILSARKILDLHEGAGPKRLQKILRKIERDVVDGLVIFGTTKGDPSVFIFDSNKTSGRGEWAVLEYDADEGLLDEYPDFVTFLEDTAKSLRLMVPARKAPSPAPAKKKPAPAKKKPAPAKKKPAPAKKKPAPAKKKPAPAKKKKKKKKNKKKKKKAGRR